MSNLTPTHQRIPRLNRHDEAHTSAERWQAITNRDPTVTSFVYAVLTTKIYCRPSCPARLARRANVEFYDTPSQAEKAGFRACKRCKPQSGLTAPSSPAALMVEKTCSAMREELAVGMKPRFAELAARAGLTVSHFHRVFKRIMGVTPGQYVAGLETALLGRDALVGPELSGLDFGVDVSEEDVVRDTESSLALPPGLSTISVDEWNDFDVLLATEQGPPSFPEPFSIDPKMILVE